MTTPSEQWIVGALRQATDRMALPPESRWIRGHHSTPHAPTIAVVGIIAIFIVGSWSGSVAERHFASTDPGPVVIDEVLGMLVTLFLNPVGWVGAFLGFLLFRLSDIVKPFPANKLEQLHGGIGVMADDLMAAIYANLALRAVIAASNWIIG